MVTALQLQLRRATLRRADFGVVHPQLSGIRTRRGAHQTAAEFYEHMIDTRRSVNRLMGQPVGAQMLHEINARTAALNVGGVGTARNPLTAVDIFSGRHEVPDSRMSHRPRLDPMNPMASARRAYRFDGAASAGQASRINYDETARSANRFISLGHELVHAWRAAHGTMVSPPEISPLNNTAPVLNLPTDPGGVVRQAVGHVARLREEFETVGLRPTPRRPNAPTENRIRAEHGRPVRTDYSGIAPTSPNYLQPLITVDTATDDRNIFERHVLNRRSPVMTFMDHLVG